MIEDAAFYGRTWTFVLLAAVFLLGAVVALRRGRRLMVAGGFPVFPGRRPGEPVLPLSVYVVIGWVALNLGVCFAVVTLLRFAGDGAARRFAVPVFLDCIPLVHSALWFFWRLGRGTLLTARDERAIMAARTVVPPAREEVIG